MKRLNVAACVMLGLGLLVAAEAKPAVQGQLVAPEKREKEFTVENKYLIMPIQNKGKGSTIKLYIEDKAVRQYGLNLAPTAEQADWYAFFTIGNYKGKKARVEAIATEAGFTLIKQSDTIPGEENFYKEPHRPQFHFSQKVGWNNDTNGLVYHNGKWHLFFQHNPVGLPWGNMTWGHATSDDLVHWKQHPDKLFPKTMAVGDCFSGSATVDKNNTAGWGENTLVVFFTDTGCGECIAYSSDGGETFTYYEKNPVVKHNGRDPKVSWYAYDEEDKPLDDKAKELGGHWVMVVYDVQQQQEVGRNAAFYTSTNMKDWTVQSHLPGYYECTDLFELPVDGDAKDTRWVVFAADAKYAVGRFDGKTFTPEHEGKHQVHYGPYYASQTFDNSPDGRRIQMGWIRIASPGPYNQHFSFPHCLTLQKSEEGIRMFATPIKEIEMLRAKSRKVNAQDLVANKPVDLAVESDLLDIRLSVEVGNAEIIELNVPGGIVKYDVKARKLNDAEMAPVDGKIDMQVLVDRSLMEIVGNGGRIYISGAGPGKKVDADKITVTATGGDAKLLQFEAHELKSIWSTALSRTKAVPKELAADEGGILPPATGGVAEPVQEEIHGLKPVTNPVFIERKDLPKELEVDLGDGVMLEMVLIPAGSFSMSGEGGGAIHKVNITKPFYLGNYEVTQEQWEKVMGGNPSQFKGAKSPVEKVSWDDCQKFLDKLNAKSGGQGGKFVLPTEAQWEYACRAGSTTKYCFGDDASKLGEYAWFRTNSEWKTHPVGEKKPNAWGLYDMHGNVWEWCQDWNRPYTAEEVTDPSGPASGWSRVFRGGCFAHQPDGVLSIIRESEAPGTKNMAIGFRVSRDNTPIKLTSNDTKVVPIKPDEIEPIGTTASSETKRPLKELAATGVNLAPVAEPSSSHVSRDTSLAALHDGHAPETSSVRGKGSYGNWPTKGTQWVQYDWTAPVCTRKIDVFWWSDGGGINVPKAYRLLYWDGKGYVPVRKPSGLGVAKDKFNTTTFDEVRTSKLRLEIDGNGDYSTGILEWKVYNEGNLPNFPPSVIAGVDRIVMRGRKTHLAGQLLRAISTDTTKVAWSKTSGPGKVVFDDAAVLATTATFSAVGDYVLTLTARKGKMSDSSTLAVRVVARPQLDIRAAGKTGVRITIQPHDSKDKFPFTPALVEREYPKAVISLRELDSAFEPVKARVGQVNVTVQSKPLSVLVTTSGNKPLQKITFAPDGTMSFALDDQPVLGMGEGGPKQTGDSWRTDKIELDRRGRLHPMTPWYGTGTYGSYNPVPLMVGTAGWGMFIPTPWGAIDLSDSETGKFIPADPIPPGTVVSRGQQRTGRIGMPPPEYFIPGTYDVFVFDARDPAALMKDISTISGQAVLPPKWVMGYQQSHRTVRDEEQMLEVVDTFREKQIPLDSVCYLGTGFCPNGWNKNQPSFEFNPRVFKRDPKEALADMHKRNVKMMVHIIPWDRDRLETIQGTIPPKPGEKLDNTHIQNYWNEHNALVDAGVDAWWPDEGDWFNFHERMKRHELYYTGPLSKQPNVRPWSLHRNGYLGVARWGGWMWPGDPLTTWRTLQTHIAIGINHSLSVSPFWNSDIGAFYTTDEYSAELYVRWVQFAAFNSLMRCHGRGWENRLPWAWGLGKPGLGEGSFTPSASEMNNPAIEPIAKKYIELRYQLLPYNYTLTWEARSSGMPMMRSMWLHYPDDKQARGIGDQYLWGRDLLIAPVYKKGATSREVYLPAGKWYDWWTDQAESGGRTVQRTVDLATLPIYVRAGAIIPVDPIRQYTSQVVDEPTTLKIYQGADGEYTLYDDDGISQGYLKGDSVQTLIKWDDSAKRLTLEPTTKQKAKRTFRLELIPDGVTKEIRYTGQRLELGF